MTDISADGSTRDFQDVDALVTDRYLESIMAAHARGADAVPTVASGRPDRDIVWAVEWLVRELPRLHPSFRFEEALAAKLGEAAARLHLPLAAGDDRVLVPLTERDPLLPPGVLDDDRPALADARAPIGRPLLIGGALTSAALSLAGAAYVAWRIRHPQPSPMARAVRAVARTRLA